MQTIIIQLKQYVLALIVHKCQIQLDINEEESDALSKALLLEHRHKKDVRKPMSSLKTTVQSRSLVRRVSSVSMQTGLGENKENIYSLLF